MKLIILIILTAIINVTLINKENSFISIDSANKEMTTQVIKTLMGNEKSSGLNRKYFIENLKAKVINNLKKYSTQIVNILLKTHIISTNKTNTTQNISSKPKADKKEKIQNS